MIWRDAQHLKPLWVPRILRAYKIFHNLDSKDDLKQCFVTRDIIDWSRRSRKRYLRCWFRSSTQNGRMVRSVSTRKRYTYFIHLLVWLQPGRSLGIHVSLPSFVHTLDRFRFENKRSLQGAVLETSLRQLKCQFDSPDCVVTAPILPGAI